MASSNERRFSLADFIKAERVKRYENEVEDFKTMKSSDDKRSVTSIQPSNDGSTEKEEISALYPVRVRRNQARQRRHSEFYDASRKSITQDMVNKELCGVVTDEDDKDHSPSTLSHGYYKRRRRFSVIQDNEGSSFTMEDKIRALQEEGGTHRKRNGRSGRSRRTNRSTISPFASSAHSRSTSGSVMFGDRHESASVYSETRRETTPKKNTSESEKSKVVNEEEHNNDDTIKVEIRKGSSRTKNIVVSLQVGDTQKLEEKDVRNSNVETYQSRISIESKHSQREGLSNSGMENSTDKMSSQIIIAQDEKNLEMNNYEPDEHNASDFSNKLLDSCISKDESNKETLSEDSATSHTQGKIENMKSPDKIRVDLESAKMQREDEMTCAEPQNKTSVASDFDKMAKVDNIQNVDPPNMLNITIDPGKPPNVHAVELQDKPGVSNVDRSKTDESMEPQNTGYFKNLIKTNESEADDNIDNGIRENTIPGESNKLHNDGTLQDTDGLSSNIQVTSSECREENKLLNVEPTNKSKAETDLSNQNDTKETNNYIGNGDETNGISNREFWNLETENDENKSKASEDMSENVKVSISDTPKTDMNDITSEEMASRVDQPIPQTTVDPLTSSNEEQKAIKFSQSIVIESDDITSNEAERQGVFLYNGSKTTVSHTNSSESTRDDEMEEETDGQKSKSNQSMEQHEAVEARMNISENKTTSSKHENQISVDLSETNKISHATEKPRVTTLTIDDSKTEKRTGGNNPKSLSQMSLPNNFHSFAKSLKSLLQEEIEYSELFVKSLQDVRAHNANMCKSTTRRLHKEEGSSDPDQSPGTSLEQTSLGRTTALSVTIHTERDDDMQETAKQRNVEKMTQNEELNGSTGKEKTNFVFNQDTVWDKNPLNDSIKDCNKDCNKDTDDKKDQIDDCNKDMDKEKDSLNNCKTDKNEEKKQPNGCNQDEVNEKDSLDEYSQNKDKEKNLPNVCGQDTDKKKDSVDDCKTDIDKEKDSLNDCDEDTNKNKDSLNDCDENTNKNKDSFNNCNKDTNNEKDLLHDCDRDTEKEQLNDCIQDTDKENDSLNDCHRETNRENYSINDCKKDFKIEKDSLNDCNKITDREKASLIDCNQDTNKEEDLLNDSNQDTNKEKDSLNGCNGDTNKEKESLNDCNQDTDKEKDSLNGCNQDTDKEKEQLNGNNRDIDKEKCKLKQNAGKEKVQLNECNQDMNKEKFLLNESSRDTNAKVQIDDSIQDTNDGTVLTDDDPPEIITSSQEATQVGISEYGEPYYITKSKATYDDGHGSVNKNEANENIFSNHSQDRQCIQDKNQNDVQEDETEEWMQSNKIPLKRLPMAKRFIENYVEQDEGFFNDAMNPKHVSKPQTPSLPKIEIVIKNDGIHRENDLTLVIKLPQDGTRTRETYVKNMKDQFCQTDEDNQRASTRPQEAIPQLSCEPPLLQSKERSFIRLHHKPSREPEPDPEVLYFIKQAELRQRRRIDDIMREIYQIKHVDLLEPPMCSCPDYVYPGSRDHHPRFLYDSDPYDSMVVNAAQYNDSVRRFLGYTKRSDRLKAMEHSRKYKAYLDLRKKLKHLY